MANPWVISPYELGIGSIADRQLENAGRAYDPLTDQFMC